MFKEQSGAVEACWAHNPEVSGSKPLSANPFLFYLIYQYLLFPFNIYGQKAPAIYKRTANYKIPINYCLGGKLPAIRQ